MDLVLQFRGTNHATVKDVNDLRKGFTQRFQQNKTAMLELKELISSSWPCFAVNSAPEAVPHNTPEHVCHSSPGCKLGNYGASEDRPLVSLPGSGLVALLNSVPPPAMTAPAPKTFP